jgi:flagellar motor switch protein FliM
MNDAVLSPEESQALMEALQEGDSPREAAVGEIDLTGGERPLRAAQPFFEKMGVQLASTWRRTLATTYRLSSEVLAEPTEITSFGELRRRLDAGMIVARLEALPSAASVLVFLGSGFVSAVVDYGFGGNGDDTTALLTREPTALERNLLRRLCVLLASDVSSTWKREAFIELSFMHLEGRSDIATMLPENTALLLCSFRLSFNSNQDEIAIALTAGSVDSIARSEARDAGSVERIPDADLVRRLHTWPVWVSAELGRCALTVDEVLDLEPGSVLRLDSMSREPVQILLNGVVKMLGRPVISEGSIAARVETWIEAESAEPSKGAEREHA